MKLECFPYVLIFAGKTEFGSEEDAHVVGDCVKVLYISFNEYVKNETPLSYGYHSLEGAFEFLATVLNIWMKKEGALETHLSLLLSQS